MIGVKGAIAITMVIMTCGHEEGERDDDTDDEDQDDEY